MSATADHAEERTNPAARLGFQPGQVVQELGYDDDAEQDSVRESRPSRVRSSSTRTTTTWPSVMLWFREEDGDLTDALVDATTMIDAGSPVWLLTPKTGREGYVEPSEIGEAAQTAGLAQTSTVNAGKDWSGSRLVTPKAARSGKR